MKPLFPSVKGKKILDLGCGYGWHCKFAAEQGAAHVLGIDLSSRMIEEAKKRNAGSDYEKLMEMEGRKKETERKIEEKLEEWLLLTES